MKIIYSFNKRGFEADYWAREIASASTPACRFIPFNHEPYLNPKSYVRAQLLDNLYHDNHAGLLRLYRDFLRMVRATGARVVIVDNCPPYHPEFLQSLSLYKVLRISDGPLSAYDRDFAYLHAYDHILYHSPAYSRDMGMEDKLRYCGARKVDFWPLGSFDALCDPSKTDANLFSGRRDIDVIFIGALYPNKMPLVAAVKKALGNRFRLYGLAGLKKNIFFNLRYGFPGWVRPVPFNKYVPLYQRAKIGINVHNRGDDTVGSYRLFDLPANGIMQISDGGRYLENFFKPGIEIESYADAHELIEKLEYYLSHDEERERIALHGFRRVRKEYRIKQLLIAASRMIVKGIVQREKTK